MKLTSLTLKNFRCFREEIVISFDDLTAFIGENDVGKSTILEALEIFFNNDVIKIDVSDLSVNAEAPVMEIICEFEDLPTALVLDSQATTSLTDEYLLTENKTLIVCKSYRATVARPKEEVFVVAQHPTADRYSDLLELTNANLKSRLNELAPNATDVQLNVNSSIRRAIWRSSHDLQIETRRIPVAKVDSGQIWDKLSQLMPSFALFRSDRPSLDSDSEVQDPMKVAVASALAEADVKQKLDDVVEAVRTSAMELADRTRRTFERISPELASDLTPDFKADPKWAGQFSLTLLSDQGIPVNKRGSGFRRLLLVSFFRAEAERKAEGGPSANIIYALEEPETSQHPNNQHMLRGALENLSNEVGRQVILTTHSPGFASDLPLGSLGFLRASSNGDRLLSQGTDTNWDDIARTLGVVPDNRVRIVICVEGPNDVTAIGHLSRALHEANPQLPDLSEDPRIAVIPLGGGTLAHWVDRQYLRGFGRPEVHIYDGDVTKYADQVAQVNQRADDSWAVQSKKLELENYLHPLAIREGIEVEVQFGDTDDIPKLISEELKRRPGRGNWTPRTVKQKLADQAFPLMNAERILQSDHDGEVEGWIRRIGEMLK